MCFRRIEQLHFEIWDNPRIIIVVLPVHLFIVFHHLFAAAYFSVLLSTQHCSCISGSVYIAFVFSHFADDNKPIWMHAEEREESKVSYYGRPYYGSGLDGGV